MMSKNKCEDEAGSSLSSNSQRLFNIYYLGESGVDKRCSSSIMPWIIEELKLKAVEMKFIWLSPGPEGVSFVADNGQELFSHSYGSILQCCIAVDGISFAYIARHEKDKYFCHVFQALTYEEAAKIMTQFKQHAREEVSVPSTLANSSTGADVKPSGYIISSAHSGTLSQADEEYRLEYMGRHEVASPATASSDQVQIIDSLVSKIREAMVASGKARSKKKSLGSRLRGKANTSKSSLVSSESVDQDGRDNVTTNSLVSDSVSIAFSSAGMQNLSDNNLEGTRPLEQEPDPGDVSIILTRSSPDEGNKVHRDISLPDDHGDQHSSCRQTPPNSDKKEKEKVSESSDFDIIPELANLKTSTEFQALSLKTDASSIIVNKKVRLVFTGVSVVVLTEETGDTILKKSIKSIACCAQGKKESEYLAFTSRSKEDKKYFCYLFMAKNSKMAIKVLESFKSAFVHALSLTMQPAICEYCPLKQMHLLCKNLEGVSTQVAQSRIQECLATFNESDYNSIMMQYKASEHADHEYTQIIVLVALLRQHFKKQQDKHTHRGLISSKRRGGITSNPDPVLDDTTARLRLPALARAKMAITNSFDNLRSKSGQEKKQLKSSDEERVEEVKTIDVTQSLNVRPRSPLFSRKTNIDTLMAPIATSPKQGGLTKHRNRSWTGGERLQSSRHTMTVTQENKKTENQDKRTENLVQDDHKTVIFKTPPTLKDKRLHEPGRKKRLSLTPPSVSPLKKEYQRGHQRAGSHVTRSWRREIFDSVVSTPTKLDSNFPQPESDIFEEWQIIELGSQSLKSSKESPRGPSSPATLRKKWQNAINQQILLNRMEKENSVLKKEGKKKLKMYYSSHLKESPEAISRWSRLLEEMDPNPKEILEAIILGIPPSHREKVWPYLSCLYQARNTPDWDYPADLAGKGFDKLEEITTEYQHNISVDIGRTFPSHPYFSSALHEGGQSELYSVLHAYAVADPETGYCQGLSFVAGIILMHTEDVPSAFSLLYKLMNLHGYKDIYKGSLSNLQIRLYQLSRLIHDFIPALHQLLQQNEVTPFFYAAPWFLTIFASQYPVSFTARIFDLIFYEGTDILFKVALSLLKTHESALLKCNSMESICIYLKTSLPEETLGMENAILQQAMEFEFNGRLKIFETEYQVMDELNSRFHIEDPTVPDMDSIITLIRKTNLSMIEELAICHGSITTLQDQIQHLMLQVQTQQETIQRLEARIGVEESETLILKQSTV